MATTAAAVGMRKRGKLPGWLKGFNQVVMALQRLGLAMGTMHVLSVPGRRSGVLRSIPVSLLTVEGQRYIVAGLDRADWVLNARVAGRGMLRRGRIEEHVSLIEVPVEDRAPILRESPTRSARRPVLHSPLWGHRRSGGVRGVGADVPGLPFRAALSTNTDLTNHPLPRSIYEVMMDQIGGSDAQLFHDRS